MPLSGASRASGRRAAIWVARSFMRELAMRIAARPQETAALQARRERRGALHHRRESASREDEGRGSQVCPGPSDGEAEVAVDYAFLASRSLISSRSISWRGGG